MARKRERERIAKSRRTLKAAQSRLSRALDVKLTGLKGRAEHEARVRSLRAQKAVQSARAKLQTALLAPVRERQRDLERRPGRHKAPEKAARKIQQDFRRAESLIKAIKAERLKGREGKAQRLIAAAIARGESAEKAYKRIARQTGLSQHAVYTMFKYADPPKK